MTKTLLELGANPEIKNKDNRKALYYVWTVIRQKGYSTEEIQEPGMVTLLTQKR